VQGAKQGRGNGTLKKNKKQEEELKKKTTQKDTSVSFFLPRKPPKKSFTAKHAKDAKEDAKKSFQRETAKAAKEYYRLRGLAPFALRLFRSFAAWRPLR
jgi:hypothetical protein